MQLIPEFNTEFKKNYAGAKASLIYHKFTDDLNTPIGAAIKLQEKNKFFFLLESVTGGNNKGRYSIISLQPDLIFKSDDKHAYISRDCKNYVKNKDIIGSLKSLHKESFIDTDPLLPPMAGGLIGYISYDALKYIEKSVISQNPDEINIPISLLIRPGINVIFDSAFSTIYIIKPVYPTKNISAEQAYEAAKKDIALIYKKLQKPLAPSKKAKSSKNNKIKFSSDFTEAEFCKMVEKAKEYIYAGDIFQVVPSQRFTASYDKSPFDYYRNLRSLNPSPFLFYLDFIDFQLIGSSPEIMVKLSNNKVTIRPLAGTRKRGKNAAEDKILANELLNNSKELAEHLMLIDLARNDVGKICQAGSVKVTEKMIIEYYSHVMHISSNVEGIIDPKFDAVDAIFSALPVGTVSGAPKVRAMQIIEELEKVRRSFYAGCVGYLGANGEADSCITLRTALIKDNKLYIQAGCGIVADSDPKSEYEETLNKAKALMLAAE